jgi:hypothetical protein
VGERGARVGGLLFLHPWLRHRHERRHLVVLRCSGRHRWSLPRARAAVARWRAVVVGLAQGAAAARRRRGVGLEQGRAATRAAESREALRGSNRQSQRGAESWKGGATVR